MKRKIFLILSLLLISKTLFSQNKLVVNITFSKLYATYDFVQNLSKYSPDNKYKELFQKSKFYTKRYISLIDQLDTLKINETYKFQGYPYAQKIMGSTRCIIERNLINNTSLKDFNQQSIGIVANEELFAFCSIIAAFQSVYETLVFNPNKVKFENQLKQLQHFIKQSNITDYFKTGLNFYHTNWNYEIPFKIAVLPSINGNGFSAKAFLNNAVIEVPVSFKKYDVLVSVLMHEVYHILYDGQPLDYKLSIEKWFNKNPSKNSQYAYLLLNETLATALGNGYVYQKLNNKLDSDDWYNVKYISKMAKQIYPLLTEYINANKVIDKIFIDEYVKTYDTYFSEWTNELSYVFMNRYIITDKREDLRYFRKYYPEAYSYQSEIPVTQTSLERLTQTPITKIIIISSSNEAKLKMVKNAFTELNDWKYDYNKEFVYTITTEDKTKLFIVNLLAGTLEKVFKNN